MVKKVFFSLVLMVTLSVTASFTHASHNPHANDAIPEKNGVYTDPGHPGVKVRVFVHPEKPTRAENAILACSLSDPDSTETVSPAGWHLPASWTYHLNPSSVPTSVGGTNLSSIVANAFAKWGTASNNKVAFVQGVQTTVARQAYDGKNVFAFARLQSGSLGVTYVRYYTSTGLVVDADTLLNKKYAWKWANSTTCAHTDAYDAENIMTHEIGHSLGLDDEYDAPLHQNATMYGYGAKGEVKKVSLEDGDTSGAYAIYNQ